MKKGLKKYRVILLTIALVAFVASVAGASTPAPTLNLAFDMAEMFTWAQMMLGAMMPVVYVTMGVGLAFVIIRALKSAFS